MPYYDTIEEDLKRAKEILDKGRVTRDLIESLPEAARAAARMGGTIYGADVYAAYMLLESFVQEIELRRRAVAEALGMENPWDHNAECRYCDEQGMHRADCAWLEQVIVENRRLTRVAAGIPLGECVCRSTRCQHGAHLHHNGVCEVCNAGNCWC